ncbi:MAG: transpeptidase family protein [Candidatus Hydrogenedentes bacterium]|nr:transpeptidase family protein [Candidatus Hydrogenedentota bacterium]
MKGRTHSYNTENDHLSCRQSERHLKALRLLFGLFACLFLFMLARHTQLVFFPGKELSSEAQYHIGVQYLEQPRGEIFDRNGIVLATNLPLPSLWVNPHHVSNPEELANYLSVYLDIPEDEILPRLARQSSTGKRRDTFPIKRWIRNIKTEELEEIISKFGKALYIKQESIRSYPHNDVASHLLGFVNLDGKASEGVELAYDDYLRGQQGKYEGRKDSSRKILPSSIFSYKEPEGGDMLQLTIDCTIQNMLEEELDNRMEDVGAKAAMGMLMDPQTGAIYALASRPAFNPNDYATTPAEFRKNKALIDVFEPGSAFKIVVASAALELGIVTPETLINCENGAFNPYGHRIRDFHPNGVIPFSRAFEESSNIAMIKLGAQVGPERFESWIRLFGFGAKTSTDFKFESVGLFRSRDKWSRLSMGSLPMGQEIAVTIPQLVQAFSVIANGGYLVQPYFVEKTENRFGETTYQYEMPPAKRILSPQTADTMRQLCYQVVLNGTGKTAAIPEYHVGGKTGTAQMARLNGKGYDPDRYTAVFAGFAPVDNPRIAAVIVVQEPSIRQRWGGHVCGPIFQKVVREALIRLQVPMDEKVDPKSGEKSPASTIMARETRTAEDQLLRRDTMPEVFEDIGVADADTASPRPSPDELDLDKDLALLITPLDKLALMPGQQIDENSNHALPDLSGMSKSEARHCLQRMGIILDAQGAGWVESQSIPPGTVLEKGATCTVFFADKIPRSTSNDTG